jgi:hypothetical protein
VVAASGGGDGGGGGVVVEVCGACNGADSGLVGHLSAGSCT